MSAPPDPFRSYGVLLQRLVPALAHAMIADAAGTARWVSDPQAAASLEATRATLVRCATDQPAGIDGIADPHGGCQRFGFHVRGANGRPLAFVLLAVDPVPGRPPDLASVHAQVLPALDCLQHELGGGAQPVDGDDLGELPLEALRALHGSSAMLLLPECQFAVHRHDGAARHDEAGLPPAQWHELLLTRAQVQRRTLAAGRPLPCKVLSAPVFDAADRVIGVLAVLRAATAPDFLQSDAAALEALAQRAGHVAGASFDLTTGFLTGPAFIAQCRARAGGVLFLDVDQLHAVNELHGMPVGDEVLGRIAQLLRNRARGGVLVARTAGDRFAMFVPGGSMEPVARIAEEIRADVMRLSGPRAAKPLEVSVSIGVSGVGPGTRALRDVLAEAESACRAAKARGRNRVELYHGPAGATAAPAMARDRGPLRDTLELLVQPVLPLGMLAATPRFEVFMRLREPDGTRLGFDRLQAAAADDAAARAMDWWVIDEVLARLAAQRVLLQECPAQFSLNLSNASLEHAPFWPRLAAAVDRAALPPGTLGFEFSEAAAVAHLAALQAPMQRLREAGVRFAVDHVGRGVGALAALAALPFSAVKIDGAPVRELARSAKARSLVLSITRLAHHLGLETVVTQVETEAIRAGAAAIGADYGQGFFIGRLVDLDQAIRDLPLHSCFEPPLAAAC